LDLLSDIFLRRGRIGGISQPLEAGGYFWPNALRR
jgi:hypothetical protein